MDIFNYKPNINNLDEILEKIEQIIPNTPIFYSNTIAPVDSIGRTDFITKLNNSSIRINATTENIITLTGCYGHQINISDNIDISNLISGINYIIWNYTDNECQITNNNIYELNGTLDNNIGENGDFALKYYGFNSYKGFKKINGSWQDIEFSKIGEVTITNGVMATPISYNQDGTFISPKFSIPKSGTLQSYNHNIGSINIVFVELIYNSNTSEGGYVKNDSIILPNMPYSPACSIWTNLYQCGFVYNNLAIPHKDYGYSIKFNHSNWLGRFIAKRIF